MVQGKPKLGSIQPPSRFGPPRYGIDASSGDTIMVFDFPSHDAGIVGEIRFYASGIAPIGSCEPDWRHIRHLGLVGWVSTCSLVPGGGPRG